MSFSMNEICILLSTYNGEKYIKELLNSVLNQSVNNYKTLVRDDGSIDHTQELLNEFKSNFPDVIFSIKDNKGNLGPRDSFFELLKHADGNYFLYCDQDDIWYENKIKVMVQKMESIERKYGKEMPLLVFSDMNIIDEKGFEIHKSFLKYSKFRISDITNGLLCGFIPGCSMAFNDAAKKAYFSAPSYRLHDTHLYLMVYLLGKIEYIPEPLMAYRIHGNNTIGLKKKPSYHVLVKDFVKYIFQSKNYRQIILNDYFKHIDCIKGSVGKDLLNAKEVYDLERVNELSYLERKKWYFKHFKPFHNSFFEGLIQLILI